MEREIQIIFPGNSASLTVNFMPQYNEIIDHEKYGRGVVVSIVTYIGTKEITGHKETSRQRWSTGAVTRVILKEID